MKYRITFLLLILILVFAGCAKAPENIGSPGIKIDLAIVENKEVYTINLTGYIENSNDDIIFLDMKGNIELINPASGKAVETFSFSIPEILPFDMGIINIKENRDEKRLHPFWKC